MDSIILITEFVKIEKSFLLKILLWLFNAIWWLIVADKLAYENWVKIKKNLI